MQNDLFYGIRVAFNDVQDTSFLIGAVSDLKSKSDVFSIEASRRFGRSLKIELEGRVLNNLDYTEQILSSFKNDSYIEFTLVKYF